MLVPVDADGGMSAATEPAIIQQIEHASSETTLVVTLVTMLAPDFSTGPGTGTFAVLRRIRLA